MSWIYLHQGGRYDKDLSLYSFRNRVLDATLGRWISQDPAGYVDGANLYAYVNDNPASMVDPSGLEGDWVAVPPAVMISGGGGDGGNRSVDPRSGRLGRPINPPGGPPDAIAWGIDLADVPPRQPKSPVPQPNGPGRQPLVIAGTPPFRFDGPIGEDPDGELAKELLRKLHDIDNTEIPLEKEITELEKKEAEQWAQKAQQALKNLADKNAKDAKWGKNLLKKLLPSNPESSAGFWKFTRMRVASGAVLLGAAAAAIYGSAHALDTDTMSTEAWQRYLQEERRGARLRRQMKQQDQ